MHCEWCSLTASGTCVVDGGPVDGVSEKWTNVSNRRTIWCLSSRKEEGRQIQWQVQTSVEQWNDRERCCNPQRHSR